ncbi:MFS transporter, partial [Candidatus Bathyarchaeota archaeon]|nr:MFS transporter [Candidatus Bathyarchaeota archaeon]
LLVAMVANTAIKTMTTGQAAQGGAAAGASYVQLYIRALGADAQQVGYLNSLTHVANMIFALPIGWLSDRVSLKKIAIAGFILSVIVPVAFTLSTSWTLAMPAMALNGITVTGMITNVFYVTSVSHSSDRATAMSLKSTLVSLVGIVVPSISALIVINFGGISAEGIRPIFIIEIFASILVLTYSLKLKEVAFLVTRNTEKRSLLQDYKEILRIPAFQKWTTTKCIRTFFATALLPFYSLFYVEVKGANVTTIAVMGTVATLGSLIFLVPFGRLADKYGRKKIIYLTRPFNFLSILIAVLAPPQYLVLASFFGAFTAVSTLMEITMEHELVPGPQRGRVAGFNSFLWGLAGIPGSLLAGYLWERVNPAYLLLLPILADLPFLAILSTIPDSLYYDQKPSQ